MYIFILVALTVWAALNGYACWRLEVVAKSIHVSGWIWWGLALVCWLSLPASRWLRDGPAWLADALELFWTHWLGMVFLLCACLLVVDCITLGGFVLKAWVFKLRLGAGLVTGLLTAIALVQGLRSPVVCEQTVVLPGLPRERDGMRLVFVSDFHLGGAIGNKWLKRVVYQIEALQPDLIAIGGDVVDHDAERVWAMVPELRGLRAPLGVWAVLGNHDIYGGASDSAELMRAAGYRVLLDESAEVVPGLRIAGVQDLGVRRRSGDAEPAIRQALAGLHKNKEGCIYISHTPVLMDVAAEAGAGLMLSGHTHGGQIWPFNYLVALQYPTVEGKYTFGSMQLLVSRGTGTWGPRMRLWRPGEIYLITLRAP